jgi:hypothetical protein
MKKEEFLETQKYFTMQKYNSQKNALTKKKKKPKSFKIFLNFNN